MSSSSFSQFPEDLKLEILTWIPHDVLPICRSVSPDWRSITYDPVFNTIRTHRTRTISGRFLQTMKRNVYSAEFVPETSSPPPYFVVPAGCSPADRAQFMSPLQRFLPCNNVKIEAVSEHRGIVFCSSREYGCSDYYVCKPATRQWMTIPAPPNTTTLLTVRSAIVVRPASSDRPLEFKIVRISYDEDSGYRTFCEIFDSRISTWKRRIEFPKHLFFWSSRENIPGILVGGRLHWLTSTNTTIFAFDVRTEKWLLIPLPDHMSACLQADWSVSKLGRREGKLCLLVKQGEWTKSWILASYREQKWEESPRGWAMEKTVTREQTLFETDLEPVDFDDRVTISYPNIIISL